MDWQTLLLASLALWRLTHLLTEEDGPWALVFKFRKWLGKGIIGQVFQCFYCLSIWLALPVGLYLGNSWLEKLLLWWAFSGAVCLLQRLTTGGGYSDLP